MEMPNIELDYVPENTGDVDNWNELFHQRENSLLNFDTKEEAPLFKVIPLGMHVLCMPSYGEAHPELLRRWQQLNIDLGNNYIKLLIDYFQPIENELITKVEGVGTGTFDITQAVENKEIHYCFSTVNGSCPKEERSVTTRGLMYLLFAGGSVITICGNLMVIISISHFKQLHTPTNLLVLSLAVADFTVGFAVMPFSMIRSVETCWYFGEAFCIFHACYDMSLTSVSIFHLIFIAVDRYYAICDPLLYASKITNSVTGLFISFSWFVPIIYSYGTIYSKVGIVQSYVSSELCLGKCVIVFNTLWGTVQFLFSFFLPCSVMLGMYLKVFLVARKHAKVIGTMENNYISEKKEIIPKRKKERKAAKAVTTVMAVFTCCWLPIYIDSILDPYINFATPSAVYDFLVWLGYFNSTFNPLIYAFFYPWFQRSLNIIITFKIFKSHSSSMNVSAAIN
ncbi:trace amine-associated receptor 13c-like [Protopterus annectens]|uniref:trace amine-associated receptor 13c-like n=1 Tax=Protopterus annectens TaxID=7888 RepID=UPI001CF9EE9E|nr:trace amine-associated receptor 13c-like [Protopterus annectens]